MIEAVWALKFGRYGVQEGAGVMVLDAGRIVGGDSSISFVGTYTVQDEKLTAKVHVKRHSRFSVNIFEIDEFDLVITGVAEAKQLRLLGEVAGQPGAVVQILATRDSELP
ncbi:hypothetical protein [Achromobacter spanius]|uniref:hypothetical protein n=1 Tax=Achromobacter spanius TaxID=217203 RepID=UPI003F68C8F3